MSLGKVHREWSRSIKVLPKHNLVVRPGPHLKKFIPSYEQDSSPECMNMIIGWEYARMWLRERDEFRKLRDRAAKPQFIENDYEWWLKLRKTNKRFCCIT